MIEQEDLPPKIAELLEEHTDTLLRADEEEALPNLTDWFDHVFVISCAHRPDRLADTKKEIVDKGIADWDKVTVVPAIVGDYTTHPAGWGSGNGAWGCVLPENRVQGRIRSASKARYAGDAVRIVTRSGARTTLTVNHPVLTEHGFVRAGDLRRGMNLLSHCGEVSQARPTKDDVEDQPPLVGEVFDALKGGGLPTRSKRRSPLDFYGDGEFLHGDIEIVDIDGPLLNPVVGPHTQGSEHDVLLRRRQYLTGLFAGSGSPHVAGTHDLSAQLGRGSLVPPVLAGGVFGAEHHAGAVQNSADTGTVGVALTGEVPRAVTEVPGDLLDGSAGIVAVRDLLHVPGRERAGVGQACGFRAAAESHPNFLQAPTNGVSLPPGGSLQRLQGCAGRIPLPEVRQHVGSKVNGSGRFYGFGAAANLDVCFDQLAFDAVAIEAELFRELSEGESRGVEVDELVEVERFHYEGDVYDFGTTCGYFTSSELGCNSGNSIIVSNCLQSHRRIMEDLMHMRDARGDMSWDRALILEDDVFFPEGSLQRLSDFMAQVPSDWGQVYLGGQHRQKTTLTDQPFVHLGNSINRTHAYAVSRQHIQKVYRHISYMPDYGSGIHIDHQLERAHNRKDWPVYSPAKWVCGQRAGSSNISGKIEEDQIWEWTGH